jgi:uncharacterized linocin/CFP29 family protein
MPDSLNPFSGKVPQGIYKTPILEEGGVLLAPTAECAFVVPGQDMQIGCVGPAGKEEKRLSSISESLTALIRRPEAICVLEG